MSRSFFTIEKKEFKCYGPNKRHKISPGVEVTAEIGELYGRYWAAYVICEYDHSKNDRCLNPKTGRNCKCPYRRMGEKGVKLEFFPGVDTGHLTMR